MAGGDRRDGTRLPPDPTGSFDELAGLGEEEFAEALLRPLEADRPAAPEALPDQTIRKVQAKLTSRDLIDLTTFVFLMRFCAPLLDLLAAFFGHDPLSPPESMSALRTGRPDDPPSEDRRDPDE